MHDRFVGHSNLFAGMEVDSHKGVPYWSIAYRGRVIDPGFDPKEVEEFLLEAIIAEPTDPTLFIYRGINGYSEEREPGQTWVYHVEVAPDSTPEEFTGRERIEIGGRVVYRGRFFGGLVG